MGFLLLLIIVISVLGFKKLFDREQFASWPITASLSSEQRQILLKHFKFYQFLPKKSKEVFEYRVAKFIRLKTFVPRQMKAVTQEMKVLIAASAIQLTFGFPQVFLSYFKYILVFPDQFFSSATQRYHKGEVNPKEKAIVLSWKHFVEGFASSEGINLGLHEMAHALQLENIVMNSEYNFLDKGAIKQWQKLASSEINRIRGGETSFFRTYGATNHSEFFAVAVENFFEKPEEFANYHPALYNVLCQLVHQDPRRLYAKLS